MTRELEKYFSKLQKEDSYNYFLFRKVYSKPNTILNYNYIDDINCQDILKPYKQNNKFLRFLLLSLSDTNFKNKLDYYSIKTLYVFLYENELGCNETYDKDLSEYIRNKLEYNLRLQSLIGTIKNNNRESVIQKIKTDDYNNPIKCVLYTSDTSFVKIVNSVVCDNEFLDIIEEKFIDKEINIKILKNIIEILRLSININEDYFSGDLESDFYAKIITYDKIEKYHVTKAKCFLKRLNKQINENEIFELKLNNNIQ